MCVRFLHQVHYISSSKVLPTYVLTDSLPYQVHYISSSKVFLQCTSRFWERQGVRGMAVSDTPCKNTYFLPAFEGSDKGVILASYVWECATTQI